MKIEIAEMSGIKSKLRDDLERLLMSAKEQSIRDLIDCLPGLDEHNDTVSIALVGPYNAGKSAIARCLTGRSEFVSDADVKTTETLEVRWNGLRIIDTPGVKAGFKQHDETTEEAVRGADLLLFCMTVELWDDTIADYFRHVTQHLGHSQTTIVVVNKTDSADADPDLRVEEVAKVAKIFAPDAPIVLVSAREYEENLEDDVPELDDASNMGGLINKIDAFNHQRGLMARAIRPLNQMRTLALEASALLVSDPAIQAELQMCARMDKTIDKFGLHAHAGIDSQIEQFRIKAQAICDDLLDKFDDNRISEFDVEQADEQMRRIAEAGSLAINEQLQELWDMTFEEVTEIANRADFIAEARTDNEFDFAQLDPKRQFDAEILNMAAGILQKFATEWMRGVRPGGRSHGLIKQAGRLLGLKFKPWGIVKASSTLGKGAAALGAAASVAATGVTIFDGIQADRQAKERSNRRDRLQDAYRQVKDDASSNLKAHYRSAVDQLVSAARAENARARKELNSVLAEFDQRTTSFTDYEARISELLRAVEIPVIELGADDQVSTV